jgi:hypothetical protein
MRKRKSPVSLPDSSVSSNDLPSNAQKETLPPWLEATLLLRKNGVLRIEFGDDGLPRTIDFGPPTMTFKSPIPQAPVPQPVAPTDTSDDPLDRQLRSIEQQRRQDDADDRLMFAAVE